jgi:hypothetical protein
MLSKLTQFAQKLLTHLAKALNRYFRHLPRSHTELLAENAVLRQQLIVLHRQAKTPRLSWRH